MSYVRNLSIRVPWHDRGWDGHICDDPEGNSACLALKLIAEGKRDAEEAAIKGEAFDAIEPQKRPPCLRSSATFLSSRLHNFESVMAYSRWSKDHNHILPKTVHVPAWGALTIPYRWMLKESGFEIAQTLELDAHNDREPASPSWLSDTSWIQGFQNQNALLNAFAAPLKAGESLVLFYAPKTPLCDDERRVLLGAAILEKAHELTEYSYAPGTSNALRAMVWERPIQHSMRRMKDGSGVTGGFIMPYQALLSAVPEHPNLDLKSCVAFAPEDGREQFSYGSEHVTAGVAAAALLSARAALERTAEILNGPWESYISWIDERLSRLWALRGPAPGLGVVLSAIHPGFNGTLFAIALADELEVNADPWPVIDEIFAGERDAPAGAPNITSMLRKHWGKIKGDAVALDRLKLLARIELTKGQVQRAMKLPAADVLRNPYMLFESDRAAVEPISFAAVDRGILPGKEVATAHPLPSSCNKQLMEYDNEFRLRAVCVQILEQSVDQGHTFLPLTALQVELSNLNVAHNVPLNANVIDLCRDDFAPLVKVTGDGDSLTLQLDRYVNCGQLISKAVSERLSVAEDKSSVGWRALVDQKFGAFNEIDTDEERARQEKADALEQVAANRFAVLIGPAGTGKTTVLQLLLSRSEIVGSRVRLLAPTGKARVRLGAETGVRDNVQTVAQFLLPDRFDPSTGRYFANSAAPKVDATTCIIDESSMLTEDMLAAIIDALPQHCRLILVGDPYQLPPIGAGCPFVDIIENLTREHNSRGVGQLTTPRRQADERFEGSVPTASLARSDVQLAAIFSGRDLPPGDDEIVVQAIAGKDDETVRYRQWESIGQLPALIQDVLAEELQCSGDQLTEYVELSLGATRNDRGYLNFEKGCADSAESWQILSVNRNLPGGSLYLNRRIKESLRLDRLQKTIDSTRVPFFKKWMRFVEPRGPEQIAYGDKVICVRNHRRKPYTYDGVGGDPEFIANGEIGMITGQMSYGNKNPRATHLELSGRSDRNFSFWSSDFSEENQPYLELAYAITVHKAQGSEFGTVILVLPRDSRLVSREMIYTALTRQKKRIWILHQGPFDRYLALRQYAFSDIAGRFTNLLREPHIEALRLAAVIPNDLGSSQKSFLEERLIHRTLRGEMVRSKNELAIANILFELEKQGLLTYQVEPMLPFEDGRGRWADFRIEANGQSWYWEHCGMMADANYRQRWERKKKLYAQNGYKEYSASNPDGRLVVTEDSANQGLDSQAIQQLARGLVNL